jgi:hypothetical protein
MTDYDWREFEDRVFNRFPEDSEGIIEWRRFLERFPPDEFNFVGQPKKIDCPRVFISHKQIDEPLARKIAWLAVQEKFEFWLDVLDPPLQSFLAAKGALDSLAEARITAAIIEMGLINCTHIIAVMTKDTRLSRWVPYEYGRVKNGKTLIGSTASWIAPSERGNFPEYLHLGNLSYTERDIRDWLKQEFMEFNRTKPASIPCGGGTWTTDVPSANLDDVQ